MNANILLIAATIPQANTRALKKWIESIYVIEKIIGRMLRDAEVL